MTTTFAANTDVTSGRSRDEIERTLARFGADQFAYAWTQQQAMIGFVIHGRQVRFLLPLPDRAAAEFTRTETGRPRTSGAAAAAFEQSVRSRWRNLALVIKAKLAAVNAGIVTFEQEFAMHMVLPDGRTVQDHVLPAIEAAYESGEVPALLGSVPTRPQLPGTRQ